MPTLSHTRCHAPQRQLGGFEPQEHDFNTISRFSPGLESPHVGQPAQRALEGKVRPRLRETINFPQYHAGSCDGRQSRLQRREARGDQVSVYEVNDLGLRGQIPSSKGRLSGAIGSGNHNASRLPRSLGHKRRYLYSLRTVAPLTEATSVDGRRSGSNSPVASSGSSFLSSQKRTDDAQLSVDNLSVLQILRVQRFAARDQC